MLPIRYLILTFSLLVFILPAFAQTNYDERMRTTRALECSDISNESSVLFTAFMKASQLDSAKSILEYWEKKCGVNEVIFRANLMVALTENAPLDSAMGDEPMAYLLRYGFRAKEIKKKDQLDYSNYKAYYSFVPPGQDFDNYSRSFFTEQLTRHNPGELAYLLADHYSGNYDTLFYRLQEGEYAYTRLARDYFKEVDEHKDKAETHIAGFAGAWIPTGAAKKLGVHPEVGFQTGVKYKRINVDMGVAFKFLRSATPYYARRTKSGNSLELTDKFFGGYIGIDAGYDIYRFKHNEIQILAGIAGDGFDALEGNKNLDIDPESVWALNGNFGIGHRFYLSNSWYLGLRAKYHIVNYAAGNVIDFTGNPVTVTFVVGNVSNYRKAYILNRLKYDWRK